MIEAVLFDLGDTLVHFETSRIKDVLATICRAGYQRLIESGHRPPTFDVYHRGLKRRFIFAFIRSKLFRREIRLVHCLKRFHEHLGIQLDVKQLEDVARSSVIPIMHRITTIDGEAHDTLASLRRAGLKLGLVSNTPFPAFALDAYLECEGLLDFFPTRVYSSEVGLMKPHPVIFRHALEQLGIPAERVLFVGDRMDNDIRGAARVGMKTEAGCDRTLRFTDCPNSRASWKIKPSDAPGPRLRKAVDRLCGGNLPDGR